MTNVIALPSRPENETSAAIETATCRFCETEKPLTPESFYQKRDGSFYTNSRCKTCEREMRAAMKARKLAEKAETAEPEVPLARRLPTMVTRQPVGKKFRYEAILADGSTITVLKTSGRRYEAASAYVRVAEVDSEGTKPLAEPVGPRVYLHAREDLAAKGSPDANLLVKRGLFERIPGAVRIVEVS